MGNNIKKRGQRILRKFSRASLRASNESREHLKENIVERVSHIQSVRLLICEWFLLVFAVILLAAAQGFWFRGSYAADAYVSGGTYTEATLGQVNSLNPLFATTSSEKTLSRLLFATLASTDYSGHSGPGLAKSVIASEDGKVWTLRLRDGLKWSDGTPLTNEDVMFTVGLIQNPAVNTIYDASLDKVRVTEGTSGEIIFTLPSAYAGFGTALEFPIVPKHELEDAQAKTLIEDDFSVSPVTSGPFMFNAVQRTELTNEEMLYLTANPNYYKGQPMLNSFAIRAYNDKEGIIGAINTNAVTATAELGGTETDKVTSRGYDKRETPINSGAFIFMNISAGPLRNGELRSAIRQGLNMTMLREAAPGTESLNYPILTSQIGLTAAPELPAENRTAATAKISELKAGGQLVLNVVSVKSGYLPEVAAKVVEQLEEMGISAQLTVYEESQEFVTNIISKRNYDILIYEIEMGADPDPLPYYHSSQATGAGLNLSGYRNALVDDLLIGARATLDSVLRAKKYEAFLDYWVADAPAIGLYRVNLTYIYNKNAWTYNTDNHLVVALDRFIDVNEWSVIKGEKDLTP